MKREPPVHKLLYSFRPDMSPITACLIPLAVDELGKLDTKLDSRLAWDEVTRKNCLRAKPQPPTERTAND